MIREKGNGSGQQWACQIRTAGERKTHPERARKVSKRRSHFEMKTATFPVKGLNFAGCAREIEKNLSKLVGIVQVDASYVLQTATVTYDERSLSETHIQELIKDCGFVCGESWNKRDSQAPFAAASESHATMPYTGQTPMAEHASDHHPAPPLESVAPPRSSRDGRHEHGTRCERSSNGARDGGRYASPLCCLVHLDSSCGPVLAPGREYLPVPPAYSFGLNPNWVLFVLSTPIVWWSGWIFHAGTWRA
jgi:Cu2+-exporting ATPase